MRNRMTLNPRRVYVRVDILVLAFFNMFCGPDPCWNDRFLARARAAVVVKAAVVVLPAAVTPRSQSQVAQVILSLQLGLQRSLGLRSRGLWFLRLWSQVLRSQVLKTLQWLQQLTPRKRQQLSPRPRPRPRPRSRPTAKPRPRPRPKVQEQLETPRALSPKQPPEARCFPENEGVVP